MTLDQTEVDFRAEGGIAALAARLCVVSKSIDGYDPADLTEPGCDGPSIDVRLRYHGAGFSLLTGDSSYDQDHRGDWGASSVGPSLTEDDAKTVAVDLYDQVLDSIAQRQEA